MTTIATGYEQDGYRFNGGDPSQQSSWTPISPEVGVVQDGYKFNGGDPSDPSSWISIDTPGDSEPRSALRAIGDTALQFGKGAVSGVRMLTDVAGADNAASAGLRNVDEALGDLLSASAKKDQQRVAEIMQEAEGKGWMGQISLGLKAAGVAPGALLAQAAGTSIPTLATALIPGAGPAALAARMGIAGAAGGVQGVGATKGAIYENTKNELLKAGVSPEEAEARAVEQQSYAGDSAGQIALGGGLGVLAGSTGMERVAAGLRNGVTKAAPGLMARVGTGGVVEAVPELIQGGQEKYATNAAMNNEGFQVDPMSGVVANATMEGVAGFGMGAAFGIPKARVIDAPGTPDAPALQIGNTPDPFISFPDGTVGRRADVEAYLNTLPEDQRLTARASLAGLTPQPARVDPIAEIGKAESVDDAIAAAQAAMVSDQSDLDSLMQSEARNLQVMRAQLAQEREKSAQLDALQDQSVQELGRLPDQQVAAAMAATDEPPTAMQLAMQRAQDKAVNTPQKAPDGTTDGVIPGLDATGDARGPDAGTSLADAGRVFDDAGQPDANPAEVAVADRATAVAARPGAADAVAFDYVKSKSGTLLVNGDPAAIRAAFPQEHGITKFTAGKPTGVLFGIKSAPQVEAALMEPELQGMTAAAFEQLHQQDVKEEIKRRLDLAKPAEVDQKKTPFKSFLREFGINSEHTSDIAGKNRFNANNVLPATFRASGMSLDGLVEQAIERGFMQEGDRGNQNKLIGMIQAEIAGEAQVSSEFADVDAQQQVERVQRMEIEALADQMGLPYDNDTSTDRLASMVKRVEDRLKGEPRGTLKADRILKNAQETVARIERKRAQYERESRLFAENSIAEQEAILEILADEDGNPAISLKANRQAVEQWYELNPTWTNQNESDAGANQDSGQAGTSDASAAQERVQDSGRVVAQAQPGSTETPGAADESQEGVAKPLYASRAVTNAADIIAWAQSQGFKTTLPADDMHVTVAYSSQPVDGAKSGKTTSSVNIEGGTRTVEPLGDGGAVVLKFSSDEMQARWKQYRDAGASWDYESYTPHVTLTYDADGMDLSKVKPYAGPIELGAEKQEALNEDNADEYVEEPTLTSPTREDVLAQQERADNAEALDNKVQIDAEASRQALTSQAAPEQRTDTSGDMFAVEKAQAEIDKRNAGVQAVKDPNQPGMFDESSDPIAETKATLDANNVTGKERLDVIKDVKSGALTVAEVQEAYTAKIEDAGQKIGGARKDKWKDRGLDLSDLDGMSESEGAELATKANVWKPDYEAMAEATEPVTAAMVKTVYDQLAAQPKKNTPEGRRNYVTMMQAVRAAYLEAKTPQGVKDAGAKLKQAIGLYSTDPAAKEKAREVLFSVYKGRSDPFVLSYNELSKAKKMVEDGFPAKGEPWKKRLSIRAYVSGGFTPRGIELTLSESAELGTPLTSDQIVSGFYRINSKDGKAVGYAPTKEDAEATAKTIYERDLKKGASDKPEPVRPNLDELKRENLPGRIDRDVTADDFVKDFGFRGVEFGNWAAQDERQRIINMAYDGLMDLAEIMGVPPKAVSLNGTMGMAFGARGGGKFAAHYEPGKLVINMTKINGGGSMAHEWAHALDHYFGELNQKDAYTTKARGASGWYDEQQYKGVPQTRMEKDAAGKWVSVAKMRLSNMRPEMAKAFDGVMSALFSGQETKAQMVRSEELSIERYQALADKETDADTKAMYLRGIESRKMALEDLRQDPEDKTYPKGRSAYAGQAQKLVGKSATGYWTRPTEMFARAFESWVFDKVAAMGARSDYLVHGVEEDRFAGGNYKGNPYPTGAERATINAAFDNLASTIQTKETVQGVAMFSRADSVDVSDPRTGISTVLLELGKLNSLYQYPRSSKSSPEDIAADKGMTISDVDRNAEDSKLWMIANTTPTDAPGVKSWIVTLPGGKHATLTDKNGEVYINVSAVGEGQGGSRVYDLAANYAFNNDLKFIGDPNGVSPAAMRRRLENMLSAAIKYGSTDFLAPHADQVEGRPDIGVPALRWTEGDTLGNIRAMVDVSVASTKSTNPVATQNVRFDAATQSLRDGENNRLDDRRLSEMLDFDGRARGTGQAGNTTLRRIALFNSLLQSVGNRAATMEFIHRQQDRGGSGIGGALEKSFYSHAAVRNPSTVERVQSAVTEFIGGKQLPNQLGSVVATTAAEIKSHWEALIDKSVNIGSEGDAGVAQAFYDPRTKTVFLIADHISQGNETAVLAHELMHKHGQAVLGKDGWTRLHGVISSWKDASADSEERAVYNYARNKVAAVGDHLSSQELFPYAIEAALKMGIQPSMAAKKGTVARWLESVRQNLQQVWGKITGKPETFKTQDLVDLAFGIAQMENPAHVGAARDALHGANESTVDSGGAMLSRTAGNPHSWNSPEASKFDDLVYKLQDKQIDTKRVVESIKATAGALADEKNVYLQEELFHGRAAARTEDFVNKELGPLINEMKMRGIDVATLDEYLHARHAEEANDLIAGRNPDIQDGGSGMTTQAARDYLAKLGSAERKRLDAVAAKVDAILADTRQLYADYGLESADTVKGWGAMFKHYVPLMREDKDGGMGIGQGFSIKGKETKGRTGSTRKVVDILANIAMQRERAIVRGEKNRVAVALVGLVKASPNTDFWQVGPPPMEKVYDPKTDSVVERADPMYKSRDNVVVAKVKQADGSVVEQAVVFNEDNERALRMASALKNLDAAQLEGLLGVSAKITRYFAAINTQYNPIFGTVNLVRDVQGALFNLTSTPLKGKAMAIAGHTLSALKGVYLDARASRDGKTPTSKWAALWEDFQNEGGQTGFRDLFSNSADRAKAIERELNPVAWMDSPLGQVFTAGGALKVPLAVAQKKATGLFDWLSDYNLAMENAVRLAAYKVALEQGLSKQQAASLGKNLTVNFNRKGQVGQQAGALYAFFNAAMQGNARLGQTLFDMEPGKAKTIRLSATGQKIVYGGVLLGSMQALLLAAAGFDDDEPPDFVRERSLIIPTGGKTYITIPMPLGLHVLPNLGRIPTEFALGGFKNPVQNVANLLGLAANSFNPIGGGASLVQMLSPTAVDPLVALAENKDWTGKPIAKTSYNKATPGHLLAKDTASYPAKLISEAINALTGGTEYTAGVMSPTPDQIDYLWGQATGGVGREVSKAQQSVSASISGEDLPIHKIPLVGRFYGNADTPSAQSGKFYSAINELNKHEAEIKGLRKDGKGAEAAQYIRDNPEARLYQMANAAERDIQKLRGRKRELIAKGAPAGLVKVVELRMAERMTRFNAMVQRLSEKQPA